MDGLWCLWISRNHQTKDSDATIFSSLVLLFRSGYDRFLLIGWSLQWETLAHGSRIHAWCPFLNLGRPIMLVYRKKNHGLLWWFQNIFKFLYSVCIYIYVYIEDNVSANSSYIYIYKSILHFDSTCVKGHSSINKRTNKWPTCSSRVTSYQKRYLIFQIIAQPQYSNHVVLDIVENHDNIIYDIY